MTITVENRTGTLDSKLHCDQCRRNLLSLGTTGVITPYVEEQLSTAAVKHERQNKRHNLTIIYYQANAKT